MDHAAPPYFCVEVRSAENFWCFGGTCEVRASGGPREVRGRFLLLGPRVHVRARAEQHADRAERGGLARRRTHLLIPVAI